MVVVVADVQPNNVPAISMMTFRRTGGNGDAICTSFEVFNAGCPRTTIDHIEGRSHHFGKTFPTGPTPSNPPNRSQ
jgi:hypothetical protein